MSDADELYSLRNHVVLGSFQKAVAEGASIRPPTDLQKIERDVYVFRAQIGLRNFAPVLSEIRESSSTPVALQAVRLLALYLSQPGSKDAVLAALNGLLADSHTAQNSTLQLVAAEIFCFEGEHNQALAYIHHSSSLELQAMVVHILLKMDRLDLAEQHVKTMQESDDDATVTQLASAWVNVASGKYDEAYFTFHELSQKYEPSALLLNGMAVCLLHQQRLAAAEPLLQEALAKNPHDSATLVNLLACAQQLRKPADAVLRLLTQLRGAPGGASFAATVDALDSTFERVATTLSA